jgi:hypothetical protein
MFCRYTSSEMKQTSKLLFLATFSLLVLRGAPPAHAAASDVASRLFLRLAGYNLPVNDPRRAQMEALITQGRLLDAARIATLDDGFYNVTVRQIAAPLSVRDESPRAALNDFIAMFIGVARDQRDARELLYENFNYVGNNADPAFREACPTPDCTYSSDLTNGITSHTHYAALEGKNLARFLTRVSPQRPGLTDSAGVLTSYAWSLAHFTAGTNRRATEYTFREFLCTSIQEMADVSQSDFRVRRDVDRAPGGIAATYSTTCKGCHAPMDAASGAWAHFNFDPNNGYQFSSAIQAKYSQNATVFPNGYVTRDNSWVNLFTDNQNAALGWRGAMSGNGVSAFGKMVANSAAFSKCFAKRVFRKVCNKAAGDPEKALISALQQKFEASNYNIRSLAEEAAILPACVGN